MSYEGREVFICEEGHITEFDCYYGYYHESEKEHTCQYCGKPLTKVGGVDDTNGEAFASFWKENIVPQEYLERTYSDGVLTVKYIVPRYKIHREEGKFFNYETGDEYKQDYDNYIPYNED